MSLKLRRKLPKAPKGMYDKDSAQFHKEFLDNENTILDGLRKIISDSKGAKKK